MAARFYKAGFITTDTPGDLLMLSVSQTITTGRYQSLFKNDANFTITTGMAFYPSRFIITPQAANAGILEWGYGDTIVNDSVAAPTNYVKMGGSLQGVTAFVTLVFDFASQAVPADKAVVIRSSGADTRVVLCGVMF